MERKAKISFGQGTLEGEFYMDNLQVGSGLYSLKIQNQEFGKVEQ
jgi:hypothetical protein